MLNPWQSAILLVLESTHVMHLRIGILAGGGSDAWTETHVMIVEKFGAGLEIIAGLMTGGTPSAAIDRYRGLVAFNARRLRQLAA